MKRLFSLIVLALFFAAPSAANALLCVPVLGCSCTVSASPISFGNINPLSGGANATGSVTVDCSGLVDVASGVTVQLNKGLWGTLATRQMRDASNNRLNYNLYTTNLGGTVWGDGTGSTVTQTVSGGLLSLGHWSVSQDVFAQAAPTITTKPGSYNDTVTVRIDW